VTRYTIRKGKSLEREPHFAFLRVSSLLSQRTSARNLHPLLLPTGTEYHVDMTRICPHCLGANPSGRPAQADALLRKEPDDEEDEEEDEGDGKEDNDDDDNGDDGYSE